MVDDDGRRVRVTVAARGHEPPLILAIGPFYVPALPVFLLSVPAQWIAPPQWGEVDVTIDVASVSSGNRSITLHPVSLDEDAPDADDVDISLREGFHPGRAVRVRLAPKDVVLVQEDEVASPGPFTAEVSASGSVQFRARFRVRSCSDPCEVRVSRLRVAGRVFDLPAARFASEHALGLW